MNAPEWYLRDYGKYVARAPDSEIVEPAAIKDERTTTSPVDGWNFYQDCWAFRKVLATRPAWLLDVGSNALLLGLLAQFLPVTSVEVRPLTLEVENLTCLSGTITDLPYDSATVPMAMSLSVIEHIGLGRYGDSIDPYGSVRACKELQRVLVPGGYLLISAPVAGEAVTLFNAHRLLVPEQVTGWLDGCTCVETMHIIGGGMDVWCAEFVRR